MVLKLIVLFFFFAYCVLCAVLDTTEAQTAEDSIFIFKQHLVQLGGHINVQKKNDDSYRIEDINCPIVLTRVGHGTAGHLYHWAV